MFKTKEDLKQKPSKGKNLSESKYHYNCGIDSAFASISERIEFYGEWIGKPTTFIERFPELKANEIDFDYWLFHFCFDGVK